ncbi:type IX secretion system sortase PorU [Flavobacterium taihuense]|uniref:Type IX secretion system sortase PorU n=1 Tax=Flavobacterium taihuense TaxID=2857508 RepID=A0ABS6XU23_9FLAO|nr:type IX secretion system sortase PorU [Flavobacterium taihuense]MBW4360179.1 type IX secretion system sortase PorU [Flavobacterium taihuense]
MRNILLYFIVLFPILTFSQIKGGITLDWIENGGISSGNPKLQIPFFKGNSYFYDSYQRSLYCNINLNTSNELDEKSLQITNVIYEPLSMSEFGNLNPATIPSTIKATLYATKSRNSIQNFLKITPIIKDNSGYKRLKSFFYAVNNGSTKKNTSIKNKASIGNSVLASGDWYRFYIEKSGVYKISKEFLKELGLNLNGVNPKKIKIYGNGGEMLPLANTAFHPNDLTENAIQIQGESDGVFNDDDYILFYGKGVFNWNDESLTNLNLYDTKSYYYITIDGDDGKRISNTSQPISPSTLNINTYDEYQFHEVDLKNIAQVGRQWVGESFEINQDHEFFFNFPNIDTTIPVILNISLAAAAYTPTSFIVTANGLNVGTVLFPALNTSSDIQYFNETLPNNTSFPATPDIKIKLSYNNNGIPGSKGFLDYIRLKAKCKLQGFGKQFQFQYDLSSSSTGIVSYNFSNATSISQIWDITDIYNVYKIENTNQSVFSFKANLGELKKYIAIDPNDYYTPLRESRSKISNTNIKGTVFKNPQGQFQDVDYVIITPEFLRIQAEKLASFHQKKSNLNVKVLTLESIYQEFSSGKQDIAAIRNCIKYIYENPSSTEKKLRYVNLFGDASFDYKNRITNNSNIVPIYESLISNTIGEASFASDDFYGLMDDSEGNVTTYYGGIDIAVGRMLVNTTLQADEMVNKVIEYYDKKSYGNWRTHYVALADDSDKITDNTLQSRQNALADEIRDQKPFLNVSKIFLDSYTQEASAGGERYPKAKSDFYNEFEKGALVFNYLGHGGEDGLSSERLWDKSDSQNVNNQYKYPLFITITCEFSRFDNPTRPTAGEYIYWNTKGGAISLVSTIRSISQFSAENFNDVFAKNLLSYGSNQYVSIAEALRISKNENPNSATNVVLYIGDPAIFLAIPKPKVIITKVNDIPINQTIPDFKSLAKMKVTGEITDENNISITNFNGVLSTILFDKTTTKNTLNNDGYSPSMSFKTLGEAIFRGNASVTNGQFEYNFIVPKDIRIPLDNGKLSFYAKKNELLEDVWGYDTTIKVGGVNENAVADNNNPKVKLYMNDETFVSGGITNESPIFIAYMEDESGINTAAGIGHDITAVLDGDISNPIVLNDYYQTEIDNYTKGNLHFPFRNLKVGLHTITFTVWDVYNNPTTSEIQFLVVGNETVTLTNVLNYPNPCVNYTEFWFTHNKPNEPLEVQVQVLTITGKVVWTKNQTITTSGFLSRDISWNTRDDFGNKIGKGVYVYKLTVKATLSNKRVEKIEKLVIL